MSKNVSNLLLKLSFFICNKHKVLLLLVYQLNNNISLIVFHLSLLAFQSIISQFNNSNLTAMLHSTFLGTILRAVDVLMTKEKRHVGSRVLNAQHVSVHTNKDTRTARNKTHNDGDGWFAVIICCCWHSACVPWVRYLYVISVCNIEKSDSST